jgi:hypothetical protein
MGRAAAGWELCCLNGRLWPGDPQFHKSLFDKKRSVGTIWRKGLIIERFPILNNGDPLQTP